MTTMASNNGKPLAAAFRGAHMTMTMDEFKALADNVKNVGELVDLLSELPREMPTFQRGSSGNYRNGVEVRVVKTFAAHKKDTSYIGDMSDRVWKKASKGFGPKFSGLLID
jgi:hypothetical protein